MRNAMVGLVALACSLVGANTWAWGGSDSETGADIEIGKGNLVRSGQEIEFYDHDAGEYRYGDVESIQRYGSSVEVEVYDQETGEYRTFEMED